MQFPPKGYRLAVGADVPHLCELLKAEHGEKILVRDIASGQKAFPFTEYAQGPFSSEFVFGSHVLHGFDKKTGKRASLRIVENHVVEVNNEDEPTWCARSLGSVRLYIPSNNGDVL